jgi:hypothetical protein
MVDLVWGSQLDFFVRWATTEIEKREGFGLWIWIPKMVRARTPEIGVSPAYVANA